MFATICKTSKIYVFLFIVYTIDMTFDRESKDQSFVRRFFRSRLFLIILLVFITLVALSYARAYYQDYTIRQEIKTLEGEVQRLERKRLESLDILNYVMSDAFVEEKARRELNMKKPGEHVAIIEGQGGGLSTTPSLEAESEDPRQDISNPLKWVYYFFNSSYGR